MTTNPPTTFATIETARLRLELAAPEHAQALAAFMRANDAHFARWDPPRPAGFHTAEYWHTQGERSIAEYRAGSAARLVMSSRYDGALVGRINLTQIFRGPFQSCALGYQIDEAHQGRGLMTEGLKAAITFAFAKLKLHRLQAAYITTNERSARLLERLGFTKLGISDDYLFIDGAWRDHVITALINKDFDEAWLQHP
jgi:ribosomal-protein-alanine N-acetyltransferase